MRRVTNEEALRILHCPSAYLTDEDSEFAHTIPLFSKAYGQAMAVAFEALKQADALDKIRAEIEEIEKNYGLDKATKYGNENAEQQRLSYSTMMMYEVADLVDDIKEIIDKYKAERSGEDEDSD